MSNLYDPNRLQKIGEILPGLCEFAQIGDEINLGLEGDPNFPVSYRGTERPTGIITNIEKNNDATVVTAEMNDGSIKSLSSTTIGAFDTWEFTQKGFDKVLQREQEKAARSESLATKQYRGSNDYDTKMARLEGDLQNYEQSNDAFRKTMVATMREIANDVAKVAMESGVEVKFCNTLTSRYDAMMEARAESSFRGIENMSSSEDEDDEEVIEADEARSEKFDFSEYSSDDSSDDSD